MWIVKHPATLAYGRLPERTKGTVSNTVDAATYPWVQIPYLPPTCCNQHNEEPLSLTQRLFVFCAGDGHITSTCSPCSERIWSYSVAAQSRRK